MASNLQPAAASAPEMDTRVLTREQGVLIDRTKAYLGALETTERHSAVYSFLVGKTLWALKEATPHGQFEPLKENIFGESHRATLGRAMQFVQAVDFLATDKCRTVRHLDENRLLAGPDVSEQEKEKLAEELTLAAPRGMMNAIKDWRKKTAPKPAPVDAAHQAKEHVKNIEATVERAIGALEGVFHLKNQDLVLADKSLRLQLSAWAVRVNKKCLELKGKKS